MDELMATLKAIRDKEDRERKFLAAMEGIDLDEKPEEEVVEDVSKLMNPHTASKEGFGVGEGLGFMQMGGVE